MADLFSLLMTAVLALVMDILNFGAPTLNSELGHLGRLKRSTIDSYSSSCPSSYYCLLRSQCSQSGLFNPVERSIISLASCQLDDYPSNDYVCCPDKPKTISSASALKVAKIMGDKMLRIMLDKQSANPQSKMLSKSSDIDDRFMDEIMSSLENMKS